MVATLQFVTPEAMETRFGAWLRLARKSKGLSQAELGAMAGLSHVAIGDWERGRRNPYRDNVVTVARILAPEGATEEEREEFVQRALVLAFAPDSTDSVQRVPDDQREAILHRYDGLPPGAQKVVRELIEQLYDANRDRPTD